MRISDWSSDVCSSDLKAGAPLAAAVPVGIMTSAGSFGLPFRVFVGYDSREDMAFRVCESSMRRRSSIALDIRPIVQSELRPRGLYWRPADPLASTEFTYTRFLTPYLAGYQGWALFCDCDFLWLADVAGLAALADPGKAVLCEIGTASWWERVCKYV